MVESENNFAAALFRIEVRGFNMEISEIRKINPEALAKERRLFRQSVLNAISLGIPLTNINKAETLGKLKAALEEDRDFEAGFYRQSLKDL
jgi:hypothetical protein